LTRQFSELAAFHKAASSSPNPVYATYQVSGDALAQTKSTPVDSMEIDTETQSSLPEEEEENVPIRKLMLCSEEDLEGAARVSHDLELAH
jgi:hypothetical protein